MSQMLQLLEAAEPLQLPSLKYAASWAAAADASLRLVPALIERGGREPMRLAGLLADLLWGKGCKAVAKSVSEDWAASTAERKACWAAALQPLAAVHARACRLVHWLRKQPGGGSPLLARLLPTQSSYWQRLAHLLVNNWNLSRLAATAADSRGLPVRCASGWWGGAACCKACRSYLASSLMTLQAGRCAVKSHAVSTILLGHQAHSFLCDVHAALPARKPFMRRPAKRF
jgi:hypothetical protein